MLPELVENEGDLEVDAGTATIPSCGSASTTCDYANPCRVDVEH